MATFQGKAHNFEGDVVEKISAIGPCREIIRQMANLFLVGYNRP